MSLNVLVSLGELIHWVHEWLVDWWNWNTLILSLDNRIVLALERCAVWNRLLLLWSGLSLGEDITSLVSSMVSLNGIWNLPGISGRSRGALVRVASWDRFGSLLRKLVWVDEWLVNWLDWGDLVLRLHNRVGLALK